MLSKGDPFRPSSEDELELGGLSTFEALEAAAAAARAGSTLSSGS